MGTLGDAFNSVADTVSDTARYLGTHGLKDVIANVKADAGDKDMVKYTAQNGMDDFKTSFGIAATAGAAAFGKDIVAHAVPKNVGIAKDVTGGGVHTLVSGDKDKTGLFNGKPVNRFYHGEQERVLASDVLAFQKLISDKENSEQMLAESFEGALSNVTRGQLAKACRNHGINITSEQLDAFEKESVHTADDSVLMTLIDGASDDEMFNVDNGLAIFSDLTDYAVGNFERGEFSGSPESVLGLYAIQDTMNNWSDAIDHSKEDYGLSEFFKQANLSDRLPAISVAAQEGAETHIEAVGKQKGISDIEHGSSGLQNFNQADVPSIDISGRELPEVPQPVLDEPLKGYAEYDTFDDM